MAGISRRRFSAQFKAEAVQFVIQSDRPIVEAEGTGTVAHAGAVLPRLADREMTSAFRVVLARAGYIPGGGGARQPSGVSLAPEGGAHQSIKTPSIGLEQPELISFEPAFAQEVEWMLLAAMGQMARPGGKSAYLRLSTKPVDQKLADIPTDSAARERRRRQVVAGGHLRRAADAPDTTIVAMGAMIPEAMAAVERLGNLGYAVDLASVTSPSHLFEAVQGRHGQAGAPSWILDQVLLAERSAPMVTVLDGHPHTLAFLAGVNGVRARHLGVSDFGQSGDLQDVYRHHGIDTDSMVRAALDLLQ